MASLEFLDIIIRKRKAYAFTMLRRILDASVACIVHSRYAEKQVRLKGFRRPILTVPHGAEVRSLDGQKHRQALGVEPHQTLIGIFGYQRPDKQIWECLLAFYSVLAFLKDARLLILGQPHPQVPLQEGIRDLGLEGRVTVLGYQDLHDFDGYLAACDIILNPRETTFGETSGTMMRAFGLGKPVIVSDIGAFHELPDNVCVKIPRDRHERQVTIECLKWLISDRQAALAIGGEAQRWVGENCTWDRVAARCAEFIGQVGKDARSFSIPASKRKSGRTEQPRSLASSSVSQYLLRWTDPQSPAGTYFKTHSVRLVRTLQLVPPGDRESRILELGCYMQMTPALRGLLGYGEVQGGYFGCAGGRHRSGVTATDGEEFSCIIHLFNAEKDRFPYPDNYFHTILCCELLEHLQNDPMHMMSEIHRIPGPGGTLLLTTPNATSWRALAAVWLGVHPNLHSKYVMPIVRAESRHSREYTPKELLMLMSDAGFSTQHIETGSYGQYTGTYGWARRFLGVFKARVPLREECVYIVGRKANAVGTRFPAWLYEQI